MIKPNLKVQPGLIIICSEGGRREKKRGGPWLFLIGSRGEVNFLSRILRRGQQFEVHFMSDPLPKVVLCKVIILWLCVKLILIITRYMRGDMKWWGGGRVVIMLIFTIFNKEGGHMLFKWPESEGGATYRNFDSEFSSIFFLLPLYIKNNQSLRRKSYRMINISHQRVLLG